MMQNLHGPCKVLALRRASPAAWLEICCLMHGKTQLPLLFLASQLGHTCHQPSRLHSHVHMQTQPTTHMGKAIYNCAQTSRQAACAVPTCMPQQFTSKPHRRSTITRAPSCTGRGTGACRSSCCHGTSSAGDAAHVCGAPTAPWWAGGPHVYHGACLHGGHAWRCACVRPMRGGRLHHMCILVASVQTLCQVHQAAPAMQMHPSAGMARLCCCCARQSTATDTSPTR